MTEQDPDKPEEDFSDLEEMVFEEMESERQNAPRTAPSEAPFFAGQILGGRFEVLDELSDSPTSQIVRAQDRVRGGSDIALEVVRRAVLARIEDLPERIGTVIPKLKELSHDAINPLLDFGMLPDGRLYFASQALEGRRLSELLANNEPLSIEEAFGVTRRILRALEYGQTIEQLHGSLTPDNVLFEDGSEDLASGLRLLSFGHAAVLSPADRPLTPNRDLQAVGPLLAQMLVGRPIQGHLHTWWDENAPALSRGESNVVKNALLSARGEGFRGVSELREAIEALPAHSSGEEPVRLGRLVALALAAGGLGAAAIWVVQRDSQQDDAGGSGVVLAADGSDENREQAPIVDVDPLLEETGDDPLDTPLEALTSASTPNEELELVRRIDEQIRRLRDGLDVTNRTVVDLRATTQALDAKLLGIDERLSALESGKDQPESTPLVSAGPRALPLPDEASPELRAAAKGLFEGPASPFGPVGTRALHHTLTADGDQGWLVITVGRDDATPDGADRSWILEEEYLDAKGRPLGKRDVRVVQRGARFEEVDGRVYGLLDLENPWIELSSEDFQPRTDLVPPTSLGVPKGALEAFRLRVESTPSIALVEVDGNRRSWFVPGLGFVRYEDPERIRRELVLLEAR